jgi:hypothetical protein
MDHPFYYACKACNVGFIKFALKYRLVSSREAPRYFTRACSSNQVAVLKLLLADERMASAFDGYTALEATIFIKSPAFDVFEFLLQHEAVDPSVHESHILKKCIGASIPQMVVLLLNDPRVGCLSLSHFCIGSIACCWVKVLAAQGWKSIYIAFARTAQEEFCSCLILVALR